MNINLEYREKKHSYLEDFANKEKNPYTQDNTSTIENIDHPEKAITLEEQNETLSISMELDINKDNSTLSKENDLLPDPALAPRDELAALYSTSELYAGAKITDEVLPIMEVDNEETPVLSRKKDKDKKGKSAQDKNQSRPSPYRKLRNEGLPSQA